MSSVQVVILAAGMGTRLGRPFPKTLTPLRDGRTILAQQLGNVWDAMGEDAQVTVVVGFKLEQIMEAAPDVSFVYNEYFDQTNTSKSLLKALRATGDRPVLWMNGDVVFHPEVLRRIMPRIDAEESFVCVNHEAVGDEEIKYTVDAEGRIALLSKTVEGGLGEAIGINFVAARDKDALMQGLAAVDDDAYFEAGVEHAIREAGIAMLPVDISDLFAIEVDFEDDLVRANQHV